MKNKTDLKSKNPKNHCKKKYESPKMISEKLMSFGAICNGSTNGGRKSTAGAPDFCNSSRLMS